jgi:hypothetical protein
MVTKHLRDEAWWGKMFFFMMWDGGKFSSVFFFVRDGGVLSASSPMISTAFWSAAVENVFLGYEEKH